MSQLLQVVQEMAVDLTAIGFHGAPETASQKQIGSAALPLGGCDQHASSPHHVNRGVSFARAGSR